MAIEIERKFLVHKYWVYSYPNIPGNIIKQAYLFSDSNMSSRIRLSITNSVAQLAVKYANSDISRFEFEYVIPFDDGKKIYDLCSSKVVKIRYKIPVENHTWEIDVFLDDNRSLITAEIELENENELFEKPAWILDEVTHDAKYLNANLAKNPYNNWR